MGTVSSYAHARKHLARKKNQLNLINSSDDDYLEQKPDGENQRALAAASLLETPPHLAAVEHKKGYMMRKCCYESNYKKSK